MSAIKPNGKAPKPMSSDASPASSNKKKDKPDSAVQSDSDGSDLDEPVVTKKKKKSTPAESAGGGRDSNEVESDLGASGNKDKPSSTKVAKESKSESLAPGQSSIVPSDSWMTDAFKGTVLCPPSESKIKALEEIKADASAFVWTIASEEDDDTQRWKLHRDDERRLTKLEDKFDNNRCSHELDRQVEALLGMQRNTLKRRQARLPEYKAPEVIDLNKRLKTFIDANADFKKWSVTQYIDTQAAAWIKELEERCARLGFTDSASLCRILSNFCAHELSVYKATAIANSTDYEVAKAAFIQEFERSSTTLNARLEIFKLRQGDMSVDEYVADALEQQRALKEDITCPSDGALAMLIYRGFRPGLFAEVRKELNTSGATEAKSGQELLDIITALARRHESSTRPDEPKPKRNKGKKLKKSKQGPRGEESRKRTREEPSGQESDSEESEEDAKETEEIRVECSKCAANPKTKPFAYKHLEKDHWRAYKEPLDKACELCPLSIHRWFHTSDSCPSVIYKDKKTTTWTKSKRARSPPKTVGKKR